MADAFVMEPKKRIMFMKNEDYYYMTYNIIILLNELGCKESGEKEFRDHRKLSFLIDFIANPSLLAVLTEQSSAENNLSASDKQLLIHAYSNGASRLNLVTRLVQALELKKICSMHYEKNRPYVNLSLNQTALPENFVDSDVYDMERKHVQGLVSSVKRLNSLTLKSMLLKIFDENGVKIWHG